MEDRYGDGRTAGRSTTVEGAAGPGGLSGVRRGWPGPGKSREELQPRATTFTSRTTIGWAKDYGCGRTAELMARQGLNPGET